ncbi:putative dynein ATPase [Helianthus annuus]|nr:putative dynein ATPase [Helianthus annuus]KAJ0805221.1 putative dynein ATPase [Helianthus annuus]KAJ0939721.1 putative dynein ATPase [Helianthus annuus]
MSHNTATHRRSYAPPTPEIPMDHPHPDPPISTVQNISNHFSRLYLNHKARSSSLTQPPPVSDGSTTASLTKSQSQRTKLPQKRAKPHYYYFNKPVKEQSLDEEEEEEDNIKRAIVVSNKVPPEKKQQAVNLKAKDEQGFDEVKKLPKGYYDVEKPIGMLRGRRRRRSFGSSSQAELTDFFACNGVKVVSADMPPYMQIHVVDVTRKTYDSLEKFTAKTLALTLKKEFDGVYGPAWHCIVGSSFGSFVTHSVGGFMYFSMDQKIYVLLFKTAVQRAH